MSCVAAVAASAAASAADAAGPRSTERIGLPSSSPGTSRHLIVHRYGTPGARPKAYLQAALHADELPPILVFDHLLRLLDAEARRGAIGGSLVLVPFANPIGLGQHLFDAHIGRFDQDGLANFNRGFCPSLVDDVAARLAHLLGSAGAEAPASAGANVAAIREAALACLRGGGAEGSEVSEASSLRAALLALSIDADIALDAHCDSEAILHTYLGTGLWAQGGSDLAACLGSRVNLTAECSGGHPFDEAVGGLWWGLAGRFPRAAIPQACLSATIEHRGGADVDDGLAAQDAAALVRFLRRRGVLSSRPESSDLDGAAAAEGEALS